MNAKGIFKFYLADVERELKLYISPINFDPRNPLFPISYPEAYSKELADRIGLYYTQGMPFDFWAVMNGILDERAFLEQVREVDVEKNEILDLELDRFEKGVLFCYFESPDMVQHIFWRYRDPEHPLYEKDAPDDYRSAIENWYKKMDGILGSVMKRLDTKKDTIIVMSDHGFDTFRRTVHINSWLRKNGYLELKNADEEEGGNLLEKIDWSKTRAYAIGFGSIYINQKGREHEGVIDPGHETEALKEEISGKLISWIDDKYNVPVVHKIHKREEIFRGQYQDETPDLYVGFNVGYRSSWETAVGGVPKELIEDNTLRWSGSHIFDSELVPGILLLNKKITKEKASIYDIIPTILEVSGYAKTEIKAMHFQGEALFNLY